MYTPTRNMIKLFVCLMLFVGVVPLVFAAAPTYTVAILQATSVGDTLNVSGLVTSSRPTQPATAVTIDVIPPSGSAIRVITNLPIPATAESPYSWRGPLPNGTPIPNGSLVRVWSNRQSVATRPITRTVNVFFQRHITSGQTVHGSATFPPASDGYGSILMTVDFDCPNDSCDPWDRVGLFSVNHNGKWFEISRFVTAYGVGFSNTYDVTELSHLLSGTVEMKAFVDTWGPQGVYANLSFEFQAFGSATEQREYISIFEPRRVVYGDPSVSSVLDTSITLPSGYSRTGLLYSFITGHGQGNTENCAEFCSKTDTFSVNAIPYTKAIWRDNCDSTITKHTQRGTWQFNRAGWCPGSIAYPWKQEIPNLSPDSVRVNYSPEHYVNDLRPPNHPYNATGHTEPYYLISAMLILSKQD